MSDLKAAIPAAGTEVLPLDEGARVVADTITHGLRAEDRPALLAQLVESFGGPCDVVLLAVPAGEGVIVEHAVTKWLRVEEPQS
jgi:hypothetical protein